MRIENNFLIPYCSNDELDMAIQKSYENGCARQRVLDKLIYCDKYDDPTVHKHRNWKWMKKRGRKVVVPYFNREGVVYKGYYYLPIWEALHG